MTTTRRNGRTLRRALMAAAAITGLPAAALANDEVMAQDPDATQLEEIVVTAAGFEQRITQAPASISVLPRQEIEEQRASSIAEILNNVEGVDTGAGVGKTGGQTINIRGMGSDYTLILIDGRRQNTAGSTTPNGFGETATSFMPPVSAIERIEVVRGPVSTLYGSDAMGGVINIITRKVGDEWRGSVAGNYTLQGDDEFGDFWGTNFYAAGPLVADRVGLSLRGSWQEREQSGLTYVNVNGVRAPVTGFGRSATSYEIWNLGARLALNLHADHDLWLDLDTAEQWYDNRANQLGTQGVAGGYADALEFNRNQQVLAHNWRASFGTIESTLSRNYTEKLGRIIPALVPVVGGQPRDIESTSIIFDTKLHSEWRNHNFTLGGQYWDAEMIDGVAPAPFTFEQWALFAEDEWRFTETLAVTLGMRYDDHSTFGDHLSPRIYAVWNATDEWTIKGGVSAGYKAPRVEQLAPGINGFGSQGRLPLIGSPGLTPETSVSTELAVFYDNRSTLRASVTVFHNAFEDKIATGVPRLNCSYAPVIPGSSPPVRDNGFLNRPGCIDVGNYPDYDTYGQSTNIDEAETSGLEAMARWRFAPDWSVQANYTYTESEQTSGAAVGQPLTDTPRHMVNGQLRWQATENLNLWLRGEYRSERFRNDAAPRAVWGNYKAYELFHLGGSYQVNDRVSVSATIYNLLDTDFVSLLPYGSLTTPSYTPEYANNQEPRRLYVGVNVDF